MRTKKKVREKKIKRGAVEIFGMAWRWCPGAAGLWAAGAPLTSLLVFLSPAPLLTLILRLQIPGQFQAASYTLLLLTGWIISLFSWQSELFLGFLAISNRVRKKSRNGNVTQREAMELVLTFPYFFLRISFQKSIFQTRAGSEVVLPSEQMAVLPLIATEERFCPLLQKQSAPHKLLLLHFLKLGLQNQWFL